MSKHSLMSKKIAQLTKVVHQLYVTNEEHTNEIQARESIHRDEINILKVDMDDKISSLSKIILEKDETIKELIQKLEIINNEHKEEQKLLRQKMEDDEVKMRHVETDLKQIYDTDIKNLTIAYKKLMDRLEKVKHKAVSRSVSFNQDIEQMKGQIIECKLSYQKKMEQNHIDMILSHEENIVQLKNVHKSELKNLHIQLSNDKEVAVQQKSKIHAIEMEKMKMLNDEETCRLLLEYDKNVRKEKDVHIYSISDIESVLFRESLNHEETTRKLEQERKMKNSNLEVVDCLRGELDKLKVTRIQESSRQEERIVSLTKQISEANVRIRSIIPKAILSEIRLQHTSLEMKKDEIKYLSIQSKYNDLQTSYHRIFQELEKEQSIRKETNSRLESEILMLNEAKQILEQKITDYKTQILEQDNTTRQTIANQKEKIMNLMAYQSKLRHSFRNVKGDIQCALDNFRNALKHAHKNINEATMMDKSANQMRLQEIQLQYKDKYNTKVEEMKCKQLKEIEKLQRESKLRENEMVQCFQSRIENDSRKIQNEARKNLERVETERSSLEQKLDEAMKDMENLRTKYETTIANMKQHEKKIQIEKQEYIDENTLLQRKSKDVQNLIVEKDVKIEQLRRIIAELDGDILQLKKKYDENTQKYDDRINSIKTEHMGDIEKINTHMHDVIEREKANQKQLTEESITKVKDEFEKTLNAVSRRHVEEKSTLLLQMREQKNVHEKNLLLKETDYKRKELQFQQSILSQQKCHEKNKADLKSYLMEECNKKIKVIEKSHEESMSEKEKMITHEKQKYERIMEERLFHKIMEMSASTESKQHVLNLNHKRTISEMEKTLLSSYENDLRQKRREWDEEREKLKKEIDKMYSEQQRLILNHNKTQSDLGKKEEELTHLRNSLRDEKSNHSSMYQQIIWDSDSLVQEIKAKAEDEKLQIQAENIKEIERLEDKLKTMKDTIQHMSEKYLNRESRPEDLETIANLNKENKDLQLKENKSRQDMLYFKQELWNREENFNFRFRGETAPSIVGVMNIVDIKSSKKNKGRVREKMRRHTTKFNALPKV